MMTRADYLKLDNTKLYYSAIEKQIQYASRLIYFNDFLK